MVLEAAPPRFGAAASGWPGFANVAGGRRTLHRTFARGSHEHFAPSIVFSRRPPCPPAVMPGQTEAIASVGSWSFVLARPTLEDNVAYSLAVRSTKAMPASAKRLAQAAETTPANTASAAPRAELIHPGVRKYLKRSGSRRLCDATAVAHARPRL